MWFFCDECPEYIIPDEEVNDAPNDLLMNFSVYNYQRRCPKHVIITNGPISCKIFEENYDINNGLFNRPT